MVNFVGLDQSYTGFGITVDHAEAARTHVTAFPMSKYSCTGERLEHIKIVVSDNVTYSSVVCMEGYANGSKFGRELAGELGGAVKSVLWEGYRIDPFIVSPSSLKKFVLGAGKGTKAEMLLGVYKKWGESFTDDNAADSYALAKIAEALTNPEKIQFKYEQEVIDVVRKRGAK